jgi:hypothetical protein
MSSALLAQPLIKDVAADVRRLGTNDRFQIHLSLVTSAATKESAWDGLTGRGGVPAERRKILKTEVHGFLPKAATPVSIPYS